MEDEEIEVVRELAVDEFDFGTTIRFMSDGSLQLRVPCMPPSWATGQRLFDDLGPALGTQLGVRVQGLDKELFSVPAPAADTGQRLRDCLIELRRRLAT